MLTTCHTLGVNHNGGGLGFGPDGKLYASVGENGLTPDAAQSRENLRGKILRYNKDGSIPDDNPFGSDSPIFALGYEIHSGSCFSREPVRYSRQKTARA